MEEVTLSNFESGLRQISEVAVKALSPGINDPGTALNAIDFLTLLFLQHMQGIPPDCHLDKYRQARILKHPTPLSTLIYRFLTPIRTYGKADVMVMRKLLLCLEHLLYQDKDQQAFTQQLAQQIKVVREDADYYIKSLEDRAEINSVIKSINQYFPNPKDNIPLLP